MKEACAPNLFRDVRSRTVVCVGRETNRQGLGHCLPNGRHTEAPSFHSQLNSVPNRKNGLQCI